MNQTDFPAISIIIPVKPGGHVKALDAVKELDYPPDRLEVFVSEGRRPSRQRNEAAKASRGEILYFLDDDSLPSSNNPGLIAKHYRDPSVAVVGGPSITPGDDTFIQQCFAYLFKSPFGGAGIRNRYRRSGVARISSGKELILCNLSFRAALFKSLGGLNEGLYPNEENELMARIKEKDYKMIYDPDIFVSRSQRETVWAFIKQVFSYGRGRMEQTILCPSSFEATHFIPLVFLMYCVSLLVMADIYYLIPIFCYAVLVLFFSLNDLLFEDIPRREKAGRFFVLSVLFPLMHLSYGAGMVGGLKRYFGKASPPDAEVKVSRVAGDPEK